MPFTPHFALGVLLLAWAHLRAAFQRPQQRPLQATHCDSSLVDVGMVGVSDLPLPYTSDPPPAPATCGCAHRVPWSSAARGPGGLPRKSLPDLSPWALEYLIFTRFWE